MKKTIVITIVVVLALLGILSYYRFHTKSFSPESEVKFESNGLKIRIQYSRPYKKGRVIFGLAGASSTLVPYGRVWRTGANEATQFETNKDLNFGGKILKAGTYSLWTVPGEQTWTVMFNSEYGQWGIDFSGEANRNAKDDVLTIEVPARTQDKVFEQFTISLEEVGDEMEMNLLWDTTLITLPFSR